jgi:hypothetical protein
MTSVKAGLMSTELAADSNEKSDARGANELEQELFTLNAVAPALLEQLPGLFEEAVRESLSHILGMKESTGVLRWLHDAALGSRPEVFARLASRYGDRASPLQARIDEAFERRVRNLVELAVRAQPNL